MDARALGPGSGGAGPVRRVRCGNAFPLRGWSFPGKCNASTGGFGCPSRPDGLPKHFPGKPLAPVGIVLASGHRPSPGSEKGVRRSARLPIGKEGPALPREVRRPRGCAAGGPPDPSPGSGALMPAVSIVLLNQKGGVGKTSACHHLAGTLAKEGKRILLVDNDPQASLTQGLFGPQATRDLAPGQTVAAVY